MIQPLIYFQIVKDKICFLRRYLTTLKRKISTCCEMKEKCISFSISKHFKPNFICKTLETLQEQKGALFWFSETFPLTIKCLISFKTGEQALKVKSPLIQ